MTAALGSAANLVFKTAGGDVVAVLAMSAPAFAPAAGGIASANAIANDVSAPGGIIARAEFQTGAGTPIIWCSVTEFDGGGDIEIDELLVHPGQTVAAKNIFYMAPP